MRAASVVGEVLRDVPVRHDAGEHELVAAEPRGEVVAADQPQQPLPDRAQHGVAGRVAVPVVHGLEAVEVDVGQHDVGVLAGAQQLDEAAVEHPAVVEAGQRVAVRDVLEGQLVGLAGVHVEDLHQDVRRGVG